MQIKTVKCRRNGIIKIVPQDVYLAKWKGLGYKIVPSEPEESKNTSEPTGYDSMTYQELKSIGSRKGLNTFGLKRDELIAKLKEMEE